MAGEEQRHGLVAQLLVGHARAIVLVAGVQQDGQQIRLLLPTLPPLLDKAVDDGVEAAHGPVEANLAGRRQPGRQPEQAGETGAKAIQQHFQRSADVAGFLADVSTEERFGGNHQRQSHHLGGDVTRFAGNPTAQHLLGRGRHVGNVSGQPTAGRPAG